MQLHEQYPPLNNSTYLNTPTSGLLSKDILTWRRQHDEDFFRRGYFFRDNFDGFLYGVKETLANFFQADASNTFLIPNFSFGFNTLLEGLSKEERFLLLQEDYPSVNYPVESRGFTCTHVAVSEHLEQDILAQIETFKPTVFAFSLVQYISGIAIDLTFIKQLKETYPELLLIADGTQFCGTRKFDFSASGLDVLAGSGYKWMMAGYGSGFIFLKAALLERLYTQAQKHPKPMAPFLKDKGLLTLLFEPGHQDTLIYGTLQQAVLAFERIGMRDIEQHISSLAEQAKIAFTERGLLTNAVIKRETHSSIFNLSIDETTYQRLQQANIVCVRRGRGVRIGFHFFNTTEDLAKALAAIDY
ncbi:aminotransferase class V-fold PLP-dependent enzyme [Olivibacter sp. SDN3]|uniref:aminotransferase class V-fold PLP-dependent enzyme n=1 Tax=Olivibacter sp. SDN3 TaxID=2764720 RepID=UPI0016511421|nr:aminotransferase class V-fold PLP-dependent enzyme [Olivibacter sp. SDN3]QNL50935.1 aminotransferase class V-fold PLP-dependent enzyme [Olivibacter sp. SDN3]